MEEERKRGRGRAESIGWKPFDEYVSLIREKKIARHPSEVS